VSYLPFDVLTITVGRAYNMKERPANYKIIPFARPGGEKSDWKTNDEMGGWCGSRQRKNSSKEMEETG
jgi:hypothetical protein